MANARPQKKPKGPFGLSPLALIGVSALLVIIGIAGGIGLDLLLRPGESPPRSVPRREVPPPIVRNLMPEEADQARPSILAEPTAHADSAKTAPPPPAMPEQAPAPFRPIAKPIPASPAFASLPPTPVAEGTGVLAIVIDDMGLDRTRSEMALGLPGAVTVSVMTYAPDPSALAKQAHDAGHEVLAHLPMQPLSGKEYPGPHALTVAMDDATIRSTLALDLDHWQGYVGVNNHMGSRFTLDKQRMAVVIDELKARGLFWLDSRTTNDSVGPAVAQAAGLPFVARDVFLDNVETVPAVLAQLERAVTMAKTHGSAIAIGHPHDTTIAALKQALPTLAARGVTLVPVTEILKRRGQVPPS